APFGSVLWRSFIVGMPDILNPLPDIASHVVKAECVWLKRINRCRLLAVPLAAAASAIGVVLARPIAPKIAGRRASPRGILPFGLCQKAVGFAVHASHYP